MIRLFLVLLLCCSSAFAALETKPAQMSGYRWKSPVQTDAQAQEWAAAMAAFTQPGALCEAGKVYDYNGGYGEARLFGAYGGKSLGLSDGSTAEPNVSVGISVDLGCTLIRANGSWAGGANVPGVKLTKVAASYYCESGWTLDGQTCTREACKPGQTRGGLDGRCICDTGADVGEDGQCCPVAGSGGGAPMQWCYVPNTAASSCDAKGNNGCNVRCNNVTFQKGTGDSVQVYPKLALGQSCTYTGKKSATGVGGGGLTDDELHEVDKATKKPEAAKTPEGCLASGQGYVTGSNGTTCVSGGDTGVTQKKTETETSNNNGQGTSTEKQTESTQGPNGTGSETSTSTTHNPDGSTTTTTTTTTKNADGTVTKTTSTVTKDASGNVTDSKDTASKKDSSTFCTENPNSAICKGFEDACKDNPERLGCMDAGPVPDEGLLPSVEFGVSSISPVSVASSAQCPQGPPLPHGWGNFSFDGVCQLATGIRPVVLAMAWLAAALILIGAFKEA